jgi:ABC-type sugar transport system substrate-binding protein
MTGGQSLALFLTDPRNAYLQFLHADATAAAHAAGMSLEVFFAENQTIKQIQQIYAAVHRQNGHHTRAVILMPTHDASFQRVARYTVKAGIAWICLHRSTGDLFELRREFPEVPVALVGPDQTEIGRIQGRQALRLLPKGGDILYIRGSAGNASSTERQRGLEEAIVTSALRVRAVLDGNWTAEDTEKAVAHWLQMMGPAKVRADLVVCQSDTMATGALKALAAAEAHGVRRPPVLGCDGVAEVGRRLVDEGQLAGTVVLPATATVAVGLVVRALMRHDLPPSDVILQPTPYPAMS